jgi:RNA polymerase sigma-70 factor, ECF subfamily
MTDRDVCREMIVGNAAPIGVDTDTSLSFRSIFEQEFDYVWHSLCRLGVRESDVKDAAQEVFITVHGLLADYDPSRPLRPWLFGITYRIASRQRALARHRREVFGDAPDRADGSASPEKALEVRQRQRLAQCAIDQLELGRRAVFVLHEIDGEPVPEIAHALGIPLNTAYSRLRLAREDFRRAVRRMTASEVAR